MIYISNFFKNKNGKLVVWERPSLALWIWIAAEVLKWSLQGRAGHVVGLVGTGALIYWAVLEIADGDSPFRRVLGLVVLAMTLML